MKIYKDNFGNTAKIERIKVLPYKGSLYKETCWRLWVTSDYDNNFVYFVSVYETFTNAKMELNKLSAGTFKEVGTNEKY